MSIATPDKHPSPRQLDIALNITKALTGYLDTRAVSIVGYDELGHPNIGSGTCIQIDERYFIATAAHVITPYAPEKLFLVTENGRQEEYVREVARGFRDDPLDIAWLELESAEARKLPRDFVQLSQLQPHCSDVGKELTIVYGSPAALVHPLSLRQLDIQPVGFATGRPDASMMPHHPDPSVSLFLAYPQDGRTDANGNPVEGTPANGLSGGGVWLSHQMSPGFWSPDYARLVAIETHWSEWKFVGCCQVQHWLKMIAEDHEELRDTLHAAFGELL